MHIRPLTIFAVIWIGWIISWIVAAFWSSRTEKQVVTWETLCYRTAIVVGALLLSHVTPRLLREMRLWHVGYDGAYALAALTLAGILFAWWARIYLGRLWSAAITRKEDHRVVDSGPYAWVRHPIYTGLIVALFATAAAQATVTAFLGAGLIALGLWLKARMEERFLAAELGDAYEAYRRRVPMLVPFFRPRG
jgi:protein-S-isoprenylcysteine O-methyltransferase Ste14